MERGRPLDTEVSEEIAVLLANNLRAWPDDDDASRAVADKIEQFLVDEPTEPIELDDLAERRVVREMLDRLMTVPERANDPALRQFFDSLAPEPRR